MKRDSLFDKWFAFNYERLRAVFGRYLNEDAFHDAYLAMKKTCAFSDVAVERFEPYFFGVYKKCKSMCLRGESRYCHPDKEHFFCSGRKRKPLGRGAGGLRQACLRHPAVRAE